MFGAVHFHAGTLHEGNGHVKWIAGRTGNSKSFDQVVGRGRMAGVTDIVIIDALGLRGERTMTENTLSFFRLIEITEFLAA